MGRADRLKLVPRSAPGQQEQVRQRLKAAHRPAAMLQCRCGSREFIETKTGVEFVNGKTRGGTKQLLCVHCLMNGDRVVIA